MSVLGRLARALERNDERPNVELAEAIVAGSDRAAIRELVEALPGSPAVVQNDALKVLYEVGARKPELISAYADVFLALLGARHNRAVWGAMQALDAIAGEVPGALAPHIDAIVAAADRSTVIAKDKVVTLLAKLVRAGHGAALPVLVERVREAAPNQFPTYAEAALPVLTEREKPAFRTMLDSRLERITQGSKRKRVEALLRKLDAESKAARPKARR